MTDEEFKKACEQARVVIILLVSVLVFMITIGFLETTIGYEQADFLILFAELVVIICLCIIVLTIFWYSSTILCWLKCIKKIIIG